MGTNGYRWSTTQAWSVFSSFKGISSILISDFALWILYVNIYTSRIACKAQKFNQRENMYQKKLLVMIMKLIHYEIKKFMIFLVQSLSCRITSKKQIKHNSMTGTHPLLTGTLRCLPVWLVLT